MAKICFYKLPWNNNNITAGQCDPLYSCSESRLQVEEKVPQSL